MKIEPIGIRLEWTNIGKSECHHAVVDLSLKLTDFLPPYHDTGDFLRQKEQVLALILEALSKDLLPNLNREIDSNIRAEDSFDDPLATWITLNLQSGGEVAKEGSAWISRNRIRLVLNLRTKPEVESVVALRKTVNTQSVTESIADTLLWEIEKNLTGKEPDPTPSPLPGPLH